MFYLHILGIKSMVCVSLKNYKSSWRKWYNQWCFVRDELVRPRFFCKWPLKPIEAAFFVWGEMYGDNATNARKVERSTIVISTIQFSLLRLCFGLRLIKLNIAIIKHNLLSDLVQLMLCLTITGMLNIAFF